MKKNIAVIYRLAYILFSVWAILEKLHFSLQKFGVKLLDFTVLGCLCSLICILIIFFVSLRGTLPKGLLVFKTICTFLALLILAANLKLWTSYGNDAWILNVLLPLMMLLDYLIFDKHRRLKLWQILLGLLGTGILAALLYLLTLKVFHLPDELNVLGLFANKQDLMQLLLNLFALCGGVYLLDRLFSGELFRDVRSMFALLLRLLFLILEIQAFVHLSDMDLIAFLQSLRYYENIINFLSFLCIVSVLVYNAIHYKSSAENSHIFSRNKCFLTINMVLTFIVYHFYARGTYRPDNVALVLYYIAPLIMLLDWCLLDKSSSMRAYDPLIWCLVPLSYFSALSLIAYAGGSVLYPVTNGSFGWVGVLTVLSVAIGYIFYFIDRVIKRR